MLLMVGTRHHRYTLDMLVHTECGGRGAWIAPVSYDDLFAADLLPGGTYVFTDIDRLAPFERRLAAAAFAEMASRPDQFRPINDPARVRTRYGLLRALQIAGLNDFDAYRAAGQPRPRRFPVFVRSETDHSNPVTDLLEDQRALDDALLVLEADGRPLDDLVVIEFAAEPVAPGVWRRYTGYLIDGDVLTDIPVSEAHWLVKDGADLVGEETYLDDISAINTSRHAAVLKEAFEIGRIDFGRLDFGIVGGRVQVYEINTNPNFRGPDLEHPSAVRRAARLLAWQRQTEWMARLEARFPVTEASPFIVPLLQDFRLNNGGTALAWRP